MQPPLSLQLLKHNIMKYLIFLRNRVGGGRYFGYFNSGYFHIYDELKGSFSVHQRDVKRSYLKN